MVEQNRIGRVRRNTLAHAYSYRSEGGMWVPKEQALIGRRTKFKGFAKNSAVVVPEELLADEETHELLV